MISFRKISFKYDKYVENWIFCIDEPVFKIITVFEKKTTSNHVLNSYLFIHTLLSFDLTF